MERLKNKYKYLKLLNKIYCTFIWGGEGGHKTKQKNQPTNTNKQPSPNQNNFQPIVCYVIHPMY